MKQKKLMNRPEDIRLQAKPLTAQKDSGGRMENSSELYEQEMLRMMSFPWLLVG